MNFYLETLQLIVLFVYYFLEWLVFLVVPRRKKNVSGEIVLITGAGSGLGRELSLKFARLGATVVLWDINEEGLKEVKQLITEEGAARVHCYICDCSKRQDVYRVADQAVYGDHVVLLQKYLNFEGGIVKQECVSKMTKVKKEVGDVTILINNAGIATTKKFLDCPDSLIEKTMEVNIMAHFWTYKAFLPAMMASNHGHLVCVSSMAGRTGISYIADYCASKFAAFGFAESVSWEIRDLGKTGVKTTIVCPGVINTGMFPGYKCRWPTLFPMLEPEYVAEQIITAVRQDKAILMLPRFSYFAVFFKSVTPVKTHFLFADYFGNYSSLNDLKSGGKKD